MEEIRQHTAILFFSRSVEAELRAKKWFGDRRDQILLEELIRNTRRSMDRSGLKVIHIDEKDQRGDQFGDRFSNAISDVFEQGYERVIAIGNDNPQIGMVDWDELLLQLANPQQALVGPTHDEGTWLIAFHHAQFNKESFARIAWQSEDCIGSLLSYFKANNTEVTFLKECIDLNHMGDLRSYCCSHAVDQGLQMLVCSLLAHRPKKNSNQLGTSLAPEKGIRIVRRGPPLSV